MNDLEKLQAEQAKLEADRKKADAELKRVRKEIAAVTKAETAKRDKVIGELAREAGIADWDNATLLRAFESINKAGPMSYEHRT